MIYKWRPGKRVYCITLNKWGTIRSVEITCSGYDIRVCWDGDGEAVRLYHWPECREILRLYEA